VRVAEFGDYIRQCGQGLKRFRYFYRKHREECKVFTNSGDTLSRNLYQKLVQKLAPNGTQLYLVNVCSCSRKFQAQPTSQTARFWSRVSLQVFGANFVNVCHPI